MDVGYAAFRLRVLSTQYASNKELEFGRAACTALHLVITIDILCIASALVLLSASIFTTFFNLDTPTLTHHLLFSTTLSLYLVEALFLRQVMQ
jgi:hypothetical protein